MSDVDKMLADFKSREASQECARENRQRQAAEYAESIQTKESMQRLRSWFRASMDRGEFTANSPFARDMMAVLQITEGRRFEERLSELTKPKGMVTTDERVEQLHDSAGKFMTDVYVLLRDQDSCVIEKIEENVLTIVRFAMNRRDLLELR